jgi:hypothetical protein
MAKGICSIEGCDDPVKTRDWCGKHYHRWQRHGNPLEVASGGVAARDSAERFWEKVNKDGPIPEHAPLLGQCWMWMASLDAYGYGQFKPTKAHRFAYEQIVGPIGDLSIDHLCRVRACVNPAHMEPVTRGENVLRGEGVAAQYARRTHCKYGHAFDLLNTHINKQGTRLCRACNRRRARENQQKKDRE